MAGTQSTGDCRTRKGTMAGIVGVCVNLLLFGAKIAVGSMVHSIAITADAFNALSDAGSSLITAAGFRMSGKPADREHPFGHGRIEYVSGLVVAFALLLVGFELFTSSVGKIFAPEPVQSNIPAVIVLMLSIVGKAVLGVYYRRVGKQIHSAALMASMTDCISDCVATGAVMLSVIIHLMFHVNLDGIMGAIVAVMIFIAGIKAVKETLDPLLGQAPDPALVKHLRETVLAYEGILGVHDLLVHNYGPERYLASLHAEVDADGDMMVCHDLIDRIERDIMNECGVLTVIHMDPVQHSSPRVTELRNLVENILKEIDARLTCHDFRIVDGPSHTNVIFDVLMPHGFQWTAGMLCEQIDQMLKAKDARLFAVVTVDTSYVGEM